jgi:hypothetical protein
MLMNLTYFPYELMTMYGTMQLNDLGSYEECKKLPDAEYAVISLNFSHSPLTIFFGACMPQECIQSDYWAVTKATSDLVTGLYRAFLGGANPTTGTFRNWTEISITVRKTDEIVEVWQEGSQTGFIAYMVIVVPLLLLISVIPSIYHILKRRSEKVKELERLRL